MTFARRAAAKLVREARAAFYGLEMLQLNRHLPATISPSITPQRLFGQVSDDMWFWLLTRGLRRHAALQQWLPAVPPADVQIRFTGTAGDPTLREGWQFYRLVKRVLARHNAALSTTSTVLDYGCGWGRIIRFFLKDVAPERLIGIDCFDEVIEICQQTNRWCQFELVAPSPPTHIPANSVDLVYCYSVFSHLAEAAHAEWLAEFKRILKPGGILVATTRPREFIPGCADVRRGDITLGRTGAAAAFLDTESALAAYDRGEFCYSPVGGGGVLDSSFYGETCIPLAYVQQHWSHDFVMLEWIDDRAQCHQNVIVVRKPAHE